MDTADLHNTGYYFFSTSAQVWAALVAFGGIALRDRVNALDREREHFFEIIVERIRRIGSVVSFSPTIKAAIVPNIDTFNNEDTLLLWLEERDDLNKVIQAVDSAQPIGGFSASFSELPGEDIDSANLTIHIRNVRSYINGLRTAKRDHSSVKKSLSSLLRNGLGLIVISITSLLFASLVNATVFYLLAVIVLAWSIITMIKIVKGFVGE